MEFRTTQPMTLSPATLESLVLRGDLRGLSPTQKVEYAVYRATQLGLDPAAKPFEILNLSGKEVLYATAGLTQQLCSTQNLSVSFPVPSERIEDSLVVTARVTDPTGRSTENIGAVCIGNLKGDALANALMKCRTKAIRRTVLAHCGLGMLDETEVATIPGATVSQLPEVVIERPGDCVPAAPAAQVTTEYEWTDDDRENAKQTLMDLMETLAEAGYEETDPKFVKTVSKYRNEIGDPSSSYNNWANRVASACERILKTPKAKTQDRTQEPTATPVDLEKLDERELGDVVSKTWPIVHAKWRSEFVDGRAFNQIHQENRTKKRIADAVGEFEPGTKEWLLAVARMQNQELAA